ncbi:hypothetical protein MSG28_008236 [Choristoneura fumiferana]|nr:hypothetical protein MSG28_008236 [Choristoneura fumiferana]
MLIKIELLLLMVYFNAGRTQSPTNCTIKPAVDSMPMPMVPAMPMIYYYPVYPYYPYPICRSDRDTYLDDAKDNELEYEEFAFKNIKTVNNKDQLLVGVAHDPFRYSVPEADYLKGCHRGEPLCALENYSSQHQFVNGCAARLCECDRQFAMCVRRYPCPRRRALCRSSPLRLLQNLLMFR